MCKGFASNVKKARKRKHRNPIAMATELDTVRCARNAKLNCMSAQRLKKHVCIENV